jgi:hypothetical protein
VLRSVIRWVFMELIYRDKKVVGVFVLRFRAPLHWMCNIWGVTSEKVPFLTFSQCGEHQTC